MHELSVTQSIFDICVAEAKKHGLKRIDEVNIRLGRFTTFVPESITFYFAMMSKGSIADKARLNFNIIKIKVRCQDCDRTSESDDPVFSCPSCGGSNLEILEGRDFAVENIVGPEDNQ